MGVTVSVAVIGFPLGILLYANLTGRWYSKRQHGAEIKSAREKQDLGSEYQPYLQSKGELEAKDQCRRELDAEEGMYELSEDNQVGEISIMKNHDEIAASPRDELAVLEQPQELACFTHESGRTNTFPSVNLTPPTP